MYQGKLHMRNNQGRNNNNDKIQGKHDIKTQAFLDTMTVNESSIFE